MANVNIQNYCLLILNTIRASNLNYAVQETPYSIFLTLRKSFTKTKNLPIPESQSSYEQLTLDTTEICNLDSLHKSCRSLEKANEVLKSSLVEAKSEIEINQKTIGDLSTVKLIPQ